MGKGKGRQSGRFGSKSQRAAHAYEWQEQVDQVVRSRPPATVSSERGNATFPTQRQRPRLLGLGQLKGILRERQYQESYELRERRRRAGFLPSLSNTIDPTNQTSIPKLTDHPPGWILHHDTKRETDRASPGGIESLQAKCLKLLSRYIPEYLEATGLEGLHSALSLLPGDTLADLSIAVSKTHGISDDYAYCIGKHAHVEGLCFRSNLHIQEGMNDFLTDQGIMDLVPRLPSSMTPPEIEIDEKRLEDWESLYRDDVDDGWETQQSLTVDVLQLDGVNVGLKRLELIDCLYLSAHSILTLFQKCACITHLSLAGSIQVIQDGRDVVRGIPELLPILQVLDVTRCAWVTGDLLNEMRQAYATLYPSRMIPVVHAQAFLPSEDYII